MYRRRVETQRDTAARASRGARRAFHLLYVVRIPADVQFRSRGECPQRHHSDLCGAPAFEEPI